MPITTVLELLKSHKTRVHNLLVMQPLMVIAMIAIHRCHQLPECNNQDDDCDGLIDDNAIGVVTLYADFDGDGYGDSDQSMLSCNVNVAGFVLNSLDCNDSNASQNPLGGEGTANKTTVQWSGR